MQGVVAPLKRIIAPGFLQEPKFIYDAKADGPYKFIGYFIDLSKYQVPF